MTAVERRLFTIRNIEAAEKKGADPGHAYEFEVFAEVPVEGEFRLGPYSLVPWDADPIPEGERWSLVLRFVDHLETSDKQGKSTKTGFYHGISMPAEFCALATVLARRRMTLGDMLRLNDTAFRMTVPTHRPHRGLLAGKIDLAELATNMEALRRLPEAYHEAFVLACRMYQEAVAVIDEKPDIAYLLLVSCVEVFVAKFCPRATEADFSAEMKEALLKCADADARKVIVARILDVDRGIGRNFVSFVDSHITDAFWKSSPQITVEAGRVTKEELPVLLKRIYNQRSNTLHEAEPFPPNVLQPPDEMAEIDRRAEFTIGQRRWTNAQFIPYARFFERLVQHVLLTFLAEKTKQQATLAADSAALTPAAAVKG